jgi:hypothetical protein
MVWDIAASLERSRVAAEGVSPASQFSADGRLWLDTRGKVWDTATGELRFDAAAKVGPAELLFSADGRSLLVQCWDEYPVKWYDPYTGQEIRAAFRPIQDGAGLKPATPDGRLVLFRYGGWPVPSILDRWLAFAPILRDVFRPPQRGGYVLFESDTGRVVTRGRVYARDIAPDGTMVVEDIMSFEPGACCPTVRHRLWSTRPPKPLTWLAVAAGGWALPIAWLARRRARRLRSAV